MLETGQKLWWVAQRNRYDGWEVEVTKVGRKWAQLSNNERIDLETLVADGGAYNSPGRCYLSEAAYLEERGLGIAWSALRQRIDRAYRRPDCVTLEDIQAALELLRMSSNG